MVRPFRFIILTEIASKGFFTPFAVGGIGDGGEGGDGAVFPWVFEKLLHPDAENNISILFSFFHTAGEDDQINSIMIFA